MGKALKQESSGENSSGGMSRSCCSDLVDFYSFFSHLILTKALSDKQILVLSCFTDEATGVKCVKQQKPGTYSGAQGPAVMKPQGFTSEEWEAQEPRSVNLTWLLR